MAANMMSAPMGTRSLRRMRRLRCRSSTRRDCTSRSSARRMASSSCASSAALWPDCERTVSGPLLARVGSVGMCYLTVEDRAPHAGRLNGLDTFDQFGGLLGGGLLGLVDGVEEGAFDASG